MADSVPAPTVQLPAETVEKLREALRVWGTDYISGARGEVLTAARAVADAATPAASVPAACSHRWRAFPPDGKRYGYWRCDECGKQNEGPMCLVTTKERGVYRDPDTTAVQYVAAAEQADKGEACTDHPGFTCEEMEAAAIRVPVNDEAQAAWQAWEGMAKPVGDSVTYIAKVAFLAGFRAARGEDA